MIRYNTAVFYHFPEDKDKFDKFVANTNIITINEDIIWSSDLSKCVVVTSVEVNLSPETIKELPVYVRELNKLGEFAEKEPVVEEDTESVEEKEPIVEELNRNFQEDDSIVSTIEEINAEDKPKQTDLFT